MKIGKQINEGHKCPNCGKYGLAPMAEQFNGPYSSQIKDGFLIGAHMGFNFYRCRNCYAEFEAIPEKRVKP